MLSPWMEIDINFANIKFRWHLLTGRSIRIFLKFPPTKIPKTLIEIKFVKMDKENQFNNEECYNRVVLNCKRKFHLVLLKGWHRENCPIINYGQCFVVVVGCCVCDINFSQHSRKCHKINQLESKQASNREREAKLNGRENIEEGTRASGLRVWE